MAIDGQSAHVYQAEQDLAQLEKEYESRPRAQEYKVTHFTADSTLGNCHYWFALEP